MYKFSSDVIFVVTVSTTKFLSSNFTDKNLTIMAKALTSPAAVAKVVRIVLRGQT